MIQLKDFAAIFIACLIGITIFTSLFLENIWGIIIFSALILAVLLTFFLKLMSKVEALEKKMEMLISEKQRSEE